MRSIVSDLEPDVEPVNPRPTGPLFERPPAPDVMGGFIVPANTATNDQIIALSAVHAIQTNVFHGDRQPNGQANPEDHVVQVFYGSPARSLVIGKYLSRDASLSALQSLLVAIAKWEDR